MCVDIQYRPLPNPSVYLNRSSQEQIATTTEPPIRPLSSYATGHSKSRLIYAWAGDFKLCSPRILRVSSLTLKLDLHSRNAWPSLSAGGSNLGKLCIGSRTEQSTIDRGCFLSLLAVALQEQRVNRCFKAPWAGRNLILGVLDVCIYRGKISTVVLPFFFGS
jgi:hypothetical protein